MAVAFSAVRRRTRRTRPEQRLRPFGNGCRRPTTTCERCVQRRRAGTCAGVPGTGRLQWRSSSAIRTSCRKPALAPTPAPAARPAPPPPPPPPPKPAPAPPPKVQKITLASKALFDFDKSVLKPEGMAAIDSRDHRQAERRPEARTGPRHRPHRPHRLAAYNQKLSERRADAVRDYLVQQGCRRRTRSKPLGMGKTQPVPGVSCTMTAMKELIACLAPNRRVEVEVKGDAKM